MHIIYFEFMVDPNSFENNVFKDFPFLMSFLIFSTKPQKYELGFSPICTFL